MELLERAGHLGSLVDRFAQVGDGGHLVLISGEAGAGKSALVQALLDEHVDAARVLIGQCDDLFAPRPLGPLADIARGTRGPLSDALAADDQAAAFDALLAMLAAPPHPVVLVLEDLQWADEATLDLVRFLTRRLDGIPALILATHRDDLASDHPLRWVAGALVGPQVSRLHLPPLSLDAVRSLVADEPVDPVALHARTGGNPFFVAEVLAGEPGTLPASVRDTVLARAAPLDGTARDALDAAAVLGHRVGPDLIEAVAECDTAAIEACVVAGLLVDDGGHQVFRHDLARQAVEEAMTPLRRRQIHARALAALAEGDDVVQRAHHAVGAGDGIAILDLATRAADHCVALGAYRQAATLYGQALDHADRLPVADRRRLLEARARTCERVERMEDAVTAGEALLAILADAGDEAARGEWECWLSGVYRYANRTDDAWHVLQASVARLTPLGESTGLAQALATLAQHQMLAARSGEALSNALLAQAMAERLGCEDIAIHALDTRGTAIDCAGDASGRALIGEALARAEAAGDLDEITRASANLASSYLGSYQPLDALPHLDRGIAVATEHEMRLVRSYLLMERVRALLLLARWDEAVADVGQVLAAEADLSDPHRCHALIHLGRIRARRGDPGAFDALDEALDLALPSGELQPIHPVRIARAEAAWLAGDQARASAEVEAAIPFSEAHPEPWTVGELAHWASRVGVPWTPVGPVPDPFHQTLRGDATGAAAFWQSRGCVYEAADVLADSDEVADLRQAHDELTALGALPRARQVARRLRELGARDVRRGPRASTRANPAGLTSRELDVARLLVQGLTNAQIAERLYLSAKTVDHHVSAVLSKLAVPHRRAVSAAAAALGLDLADTALELR